MPKLRAADIEDIDVDALEAVEYSTEEFDKYDGETPPIGLTLSGYVKRLWWTRSAAKANGQGDDAMLKILWVADENEGDDEQYNGCPFWLNVPLIASAKFKWDPWMLAYGLTLRKVISTTYVSKKEDQNGAPIERIGSWKPGAENESAWCFIVTDQEPYGGAMVPRAKEWIAWDDYDPDAAPDGDEPEDIEDEAEDLEDEEPDEDEDEEPDEDEDEEPDEDEDEEPEDEPPARTRRTRAKTAQAKPARGSRTASKPATARTGSRARSGSARTAPAATARSGARTAGKARSGRTATAAPARSTRTKRRSSGNEPPF